MQTDHPPITIVGLGPGKWEALTMEAVGILQRASMVYVRRVDHPSVSMIREHLPNLAIHSFDALYQAHDSLEGVYGGMAEALSDLARRSFGVVYAVPGSPSVGDPSVRLLLDRLRTLEIAYTMVQGVSGFEPVLQAVGVTDPSWLEVLEALELDALSRENALGEVPHNDTRRPWQAPVPTARTLVPSLRSGPVASGVKTWFEKYYPSDHEVLLVRTSEAGERRAYQMPLSEIDQNGAVDDSTALFVPSLIETQNVRTFAGLMQVARTLRAPGGCPWDREQSHGSLKPHLLEEAYEVLEALDSGEPALLAEELGDLLFQVTIHTQIAAEAGEFTIEDVIEGI